MSVTPEERLLIDRYLDGTLSGIELQKFMERLDTDSKFRAAVSLQNLLVEGIVRCADKELHARLLTSIGYKKPSIPLGLKLIFTFLFVTIAGIALWNYLGPDSTGKKGNILSVSWLSRAKKSDKKELSDKMMEDNSRVKATEIDGDRHTERKSMTEKAGTPYDNRVNAEKDSLNPFVISEIQEELVVKMDQLLISQQMVIQDESGGQKENTGATEEINSSLSKDAIEKMNPAAGLEANNSQEDGSVILVEFWISPINYRGYKMAQNKLILFGLEEPDAVRLFRQDGNLYMKYLNEYFDLDYTTEYASYQPVRSKEFSAQEQK